MSTTAAPASAPAQATFRPSYLARAIAAFSGWPGLVVKIVFLSVVNALAFWAATVLADRSNWPAFGLLVLSTVLIDVIYLVPRQPGLIPLKFLVPGTVFLVAFQIAPILYTVNVAFTNYSTGHIISKAAAITAIKENSLEPAQSGTTYAMAAAHDKNGDLVLILQDQTSGKTYVGTKKGLTPIPRASVTLKAGAIVGAAGYELVPVKDLAAIGQKLTDFRVPLGNDASISPQGFDTAVPLQPTLRYDPKRGVFVRISDGAVFRDNGLGSFVSSSKEELEPGWATHVGFRNFSRAIHDPLIRKPFLRVLIWTFVFAASTVLLSFALGLFLAITLDKPGLRFQRGYRSIMIIPYAIPGFLSLLVWGGLLNDDFGVVNSLFHIHVPWLFDPYWAKVSVILVSTWLTVPYFFLVSMGSLQSIPKELIEAAKVDGGGPIQIFRRVTLPLLLVAVAPLLIASFAFNFNNFNNIYLLTGGGPATNDQPIAGATDILISYTYKLAFATGKGNDYALASSIAIVIFFIVATISGLSFWRTKSLETLR
ncbi:MAG TPA: ABC transporter permease subunit [Gaiellaceae bacterium]|nr:ABC transporter permease subunit [Gaiellaceae bacterium]